MRFARCLVLLLALGAVAPQLSRAQSFSNKDIENVLMQFIADLSQSLTESPSTKRKLLTLGSGENVQAFLEGMFGANWTSHFPQSWSLDSFDWASLGEFEYSNNLGDFLTTYDLANLTHIHSIQDMQAAVAAVEDSFCKNESFAGSVVKPAGCSGPSVKIELRPKQCILDHATKQVLCNPAKLVVTKAPGSCNKKYHSASQWKGKECKIAKVAGLVKNATVGGDIKYVPLPDIHTPSSSPARR